MTHVTNHAKLVTLKELLTIVTLVKLLNTYTKTDVPLHVQMDISDTTNQENAKNVTNTVPLVPLPTAVPIVSRVDSSLDANVSPNAQPDNSETMMENVKTVLITVRLVPPKTNVPLVKRNSYTTTNVLIHVQATCMETPLTKNVSLVTLPV